jgi:ribonuclease HII
MTAPTFDLDDLISADAIIGVDEAGCGPLAGPVIAAAFIFTKRSDIPDRLLKILNDSKKMTKQHRQEAYDIIICGRNKFCDFSFAQATVDEIDQINIRQSAKLAMLRAMDNISIDYTHALIDGNQKFLEPNYTSIVKGDQKSYSIAAASVVAKIERDKIMMDLDAQYPKYNWGKNAGYGTKKHVEAIFEHGITIHHRKTFQPIKDIVFASGF